MLLRLMTKPIRTIRPTGQSNQNPINQEQPTLAINLKKRAEHGDPPFGHEMGQGNLHTDIEKQKNHAKRAQPGNHLKNY